MTVEQLIEKLMTKNPKMEVAIAGYDYDIYKKEIVCVEIPVTESEGNFYYERESKDLILVIN